MTNKTTYPYYFTYNSYSEGGGICSGQEGEAYPSREDSNVYFTLNDAAANRGQCRWYNTDYTFTNVNKLIGKEVYIVVVRYSTGDTFGRSNGHWNAITLVSTSEEAERISDLIRASAYDERYPQFLKGKEADEHKKKEAAKEAALAELKELCPDFYPFYNGYFEHLEDVEIYKRTLYEELSSESTRKYTYK